MSPRRYTSIGWGVMLTKGEMKKLEEIALTEQGEDEFDGLENFIPPGVSMTYSDDDDDNCFIFVGKVISDDDFGTNTFTLRKNKEDITILRNFHNRYGFTDEDNYNYNYDYRHDRIRFYVKKIRFQASEYWA